MKRVREMARGLVPAAVAATIAAALVAPRAADAFPAVYVVGSDAKPTNNTTHVVVMREKQRTVLTIFPDYQGPVESFAMIVPVPSGVTKDDVKTLPRSMIERIELLDAPRLVEYWELDPCAPATEIAATQDAGSGVSSVRGFGGTQGPGKVEPHFIPAEYDVVVLGAKESSTLAAWLRANKYAVPPNVESYLKPYVDAGSKFVVVKIDAKRLPFLNGIATFSPLRIVYDAERFSLPLRLGLGSSPGVQDVFVSILARHQRYEAANYPNAVVPTNIDVVEGSKTQPQTMYTAIFDATVARSPRAFVTEYAWDATSCEACPTPAFGGDELLTFGADVLPMAPGETASPTFGSGFVLSRLHARYRRDELTEDLVLRAAEPIAGGREERSASGTLDHTFRASTTNAFQARYAVRHAWTGPMKCDHPRRGVWGGTQQGFRSQAMPAVRLGYVQRGGLKLATFLREDVPELGFALAPPDAGVTGDAGGSGSAGTSSGSATPPAKHSGCSGCKVGGVGDAAGHAAALSVVLPFVAVGVRRRKRRR